MKKIYCILLIAVFAAACTEQLAPDSGSAADETGQKTTLYFNPGAVCGLPATRTLGEDPDIHNIYVAVFDSQGKLSEYVEAIPCTYADENGTAFSYSVELKVSNTKRILHFIANGPKSLSYGKETEVIGSLCTTKDADGINEFDTAYWQRLELLEGVPEMPVEGSTDYAEKKEAYDRVMATLNNVSLVRNYSKVSLKKNESLTNFTIYGFWLVNYPDRGTVAPYNRNTKAFMSDYTSYTSIEDVESGGSGGGNYHGFALATTQYLTDVFDNEHLHTTSSSGVAVGYVYEREKALDTPMYLIIKAKLATSDNASGFDYYKIAMQDGEGDFYAMLRNFNYLVKIQGVERKGANTPEEAVNGAPTGDISLNVEFEELNNISDGNARLSISETVIVLAGNLSESKSYDDFWYKYEPDVQGHPGAISNGNTESHETPFVVIDQNYEIGASGPVLQSITIDNTDTGGQRYMHFTTVPISPIRRTQSILITGKNWNGTSYETISRKVTFHLRTTLDLNVSCGPNTDVNGYGNVAVGKDRKVTVNLAMEGDLPSQMFPLTFAIEAQNLTISPDNDYASRQELPVRNGFSKIPGRGSVPSYWYEKTVTWEEYSAASTVNAVKTIPCYFVTNTASSATPIYVIPQSVYFSMKSTQLNNHTLSEFSGFSSNRSTLTVGDPINGTATVSYTLSGSLPEDGKVYVHMSKLEPVNTNTMTYVKTEEVGGISFEIYEMDVNSLSGSFDVRGFDAGTGKLYLSAYKYADSGILQFAIRQNGIQIYYDLLKDNSSAQDFVTNLTSLTGAGGNPVVGQNCTITIYISEDTNYSNVQIGGSTATGKLSGSITVGGQQYWGYYLDDYSVGMTPGYKSIPVTVGGVSARNNAQIPVYGISISSSEVSTTNTGSFDTEAYYVFKNNGTDRFVINPGTNNTILGLATRNSSEYSSDMLWRFGNTKSTSTILAAEGSSGFYIGNTGNYEPRLSTSPSTITLEYTSSGMSIYRARTSSSYYYYDNSGTSASNTSIPGSGNSNYYWHIYKVSFTAP